MHLSLQKGSRKNEPGNNSSQQEKIPSATTEKERDGNRSKERHHMGSVLG